MSVRRLRNQAGQSLVELALILPILLIVVMGIFEFGRAWHTRQIVTDAARAGARRAVVFDADMTQDSVYAAITNELNRSGIPTSAVTILFDQTPAPGGKWRATGEMQTVYVSVQYRFGFLRPLVKAALGKDAIPIESLVTMRNE